MESTIEILGKQLNRKELEEFADYVKGWSGYPLDVEKVKELIEKYPEQGEYIVEDQGYETTCREMMMEIIALELTGMSWPLNGDETSVQKEFNKKYAEALEKTLIEKNPEKEEQIRQMFAEG